MIISLNSEGTARHGRIVSSLFNSLIKSKKNVTKFVSIKKRFTKYKGLMSVILEELR